MNYEVAVCPFCGAPAEYEGGYEGYGWIFECEHDSYSEKYGSVEPLKIPVELPGLAEALTAVAPELERQRLERAEEKEERRLHEERRRAALAPEEREAEDRRNAQMREAMRSVYGGLLTDLRRDMSRQFWS